uniref:Putative Gra-orf36-like protein n=1 Tax=Streptomyces clavuligerus TaxID=1901 RepID=A0PCJ5_STRCL|nr:putative Gra-orf36-like protein [Streptomyces clavuligerus]
MRPGTRPAVRPSGTRPLIPAQSRRWSPGARARSLPPTIKQRIRAEAHNSSPSVRKLPALDAIPADAGSVTIVSRSVRGAERSADRSRLTTAA